MHPDLKERSPFDLFGFDKRDRTFPFSRIPGKGSHGIWKHPLLVEHIVVSYQDGEDTPRYLEKQLAKGAKLLVEMEKPEEET